MKRIIAFCKSLENEIANAITPAEKLLILESAKEVISLTMNGVWATLATVAITDIEKTIK